MKLLNFNKKRTITFIIFLSIFLFSLFSLWLGSKIGLVLMIPRLILINIVGILFKWTNLFNFQEFGAYPEGMLGWILVILFYLVISFLLSGIINFFKKNN